MPYGQRESLKREGWKEVFDATLPLFSRVAGAEKVLRGWYDRSLAAAYLAGAIYWKRHPEFPRYVAMMLDQARGSGRHWFPPEVVAELEAKYGFEAGIPVGSYWFPKAYWKKRLEEGGCLTRWGPDVIARIRKLVDSPRIGKARARGRLGK